MELLETFENISISDSQDASFWHTLKSCNDLKVLASKPYNRIHPIVGHINRKLNTPATRANGLHLLKVLVSQCSDEVFSENAVSWMSQCLKGIEGHSKQKTGKLSCKTLKLLIESAVQIPELTKPIATSIVPKFLDLLSKVPRQISPSVLKCLQVLLRNYGGACGPHRSAVERFLLSFVDEECRSVVKVAAQCVVLFPLVGGGGTGGQNHVKAWLSLQQQLIATLNQLLDQLFQNISEIQTVRDTSAQPLTLPAISEDNPTVVVHRTTSRFINVAEFLQCLYRMGFPVAKSVSPPLVFGLVCRGLAVTNKTLGRKVSNEKLALSSVLPQIHVALFKILRSLIDCHGTNLLEYGSLICRLVAQTLKWTEVSNWSYGMEKPYSTLRCEACDTLVAWLISAKAGSSVELHDDELMLLLRADIVSTPPSITLTAQPASGKHLSKQQRKKLKTMSADSDRMDPSVTRVRLVDTTANHQLCVAALRALEWIIRAGGLYTQPSVHKSLQETVISLLLDIQRESDTSSYPIPYRVPACRLALYSLLHALTIESHPGWPAPTQYALRGFGKGQMDPDPKVSASCTVYLGSVRSIVQPAYPSLEFPMPVPQVQESLPRTLKSYQQPDGEGSPRSVGSVSDDDKSEFMGRKRIPSPDGLDLNIDKQPKNRMKGAGYKEASGSVSDNDERQSTGKKRIPSPDSQDPNNDMQPKKRRKGADHRGENTLNEARSKNRSSSFETLKTNDDIEEVIVDSDIQSASESDDVKEIYQISDDNILSRLKTNLTEITFEEDYIVEEVIDEESIRDLYTRKRFGKKASSTGSADSSYVQITELEEEEIKVEQTIRKCKTGKIEDTKMKVMFTGSKENRRGIVLLNPDSEDDESICIGSESDSDSSSDDEVSEKAEAPQSTRSVAVEVDDDSNVVQLSDSNDADGDPSNMNTDRDNIPSSTKHTKSSEAEENESEIEEIDLCQDDEVEKQIEELEEEASNQHDEVEKQTEELEEKASDQHDKVEKQTKEMEEEASDDDSAENENSIKQSVPASDISTANAEEEPSPDVLPDTNTTQGTVRLDDNGEVQSKDKEGGKETEIMETSAEVGDLEGEKSEENKIEETTVQGTSTNDGSVPVVSTSEVMEVDEEDMLASFVDEVKTADNIRSPEEM